VTDPSSVQLSEERAREIFYDDIVPEQFGRGVRQDEPVAVFVAGQPGAGKTRTTASLKAKLDARGGAIVVDADVYKAYHPLYRRLMAEDDQRAAALLSPDSGRWMRMAQEWLAEHRIDALTKTTMRDESYFARPAETFRRAGYRIEAAIMAVPEAQSRLGILDRYEAQVRSAGHGRLTLRDNHDSAYRGVLTTAEAIDRDRLADAVSVYRRGDELLYANHLTGDGDWRWPAGTREAIEKERARLWTPEESERFAETYARLARDLGPEFHDELADIARTAAPLQPGRSVEVSESTRHTLESLDRADAAVQDAVRREPDGRDRDVPHVPSPSWQREAG
jgi:UDP-N-acetylglucosamine kinase